MMSRRNYSVWGSVEPQNVTFAMGTDRAGKVTLSLLVQPSNTELALVTPACVTNWPRVTGDGNFGTMFGPQDIQKAKFSLDLTDAHINGIANPNWENFSNLLEAIDDKLLDFVHNNQLKILGRKNLTREEVKMLQIRSVRPKYDKMSGSLIGHSWQMSTSKYTWDGMGGKIARAVNVCDKEGSVVLGGNVAPGDVVAATAYVNQVYTGVGGDKFGIHWSFEDVSVICQRAKLEIRDRVPAFNQLQYEFGVPYEHVTPTGGEEQFSD